MNCLDCDTTMVEHEDSFVCMLCEKRKWKQNDHFFEWLEERITALEKRVTDLEV